MSEEEHGFELDNKKLCKCGEYFESEFILKDHIEEIKKKQYVEQLQKENKELKEKVKEFEDGLTPFAIKEISRKDKQIKESIQIIKKYKNPYPKDIFSWKSKVPKKITIGRFNEFVFNVVENTRRDLLKALRGK